MTSGSPSVTTAQDRARLARELRQRLEVNRLFGWAVPLSRDHTPSSQAAARPGGEGALPDRGKSPAERLRREALLEPVRAEVAACTACDLCRGRTRTVFGAGDPAARVLFVGEAPGLDEDRQGEPFVGAAGQLLTQIIKAMGLRREDVYIANVVKCRPPQNRAPHPAEVGACRQYLERQVDIVRPEVIIALGAVAARACLETELPISRLRGRFFQYRGVPLLATYHPAYLLRYPGEKIKVWEDLQVVMARLGLQRPTGAGS